MIHDLMLIFFKTVVINVDKNFFVKEKDVDVTLFMTDDFESKVTLYFNAWKVSKYGVFSSLYFPAFRLNTERNIWAPFTQYLLFSKVDSSFDLL